MYESSQFHKVHVWAFVGHTNFALFTQLTAPCTPHIINRHFIITNIIAGGVVHHDKNVYLFAKAAPSY